VAYITACTTVQAVINVKKTLSVSPMLRPIISETSKTAKIILVLYWHVILTEIAENNNLLEHMLG